MRAKVRTPDGRAMTARPWIGGTLGGVLLGLGVLGPNCDVNFVIQGGPGVLVFVSQNTAITAAYRFHHLSNADRCPQNLGLNSSLFTVGLSYFFP